MEEGPGPRVGRGQFSLKGSYNIIPADPIKVGNRRQLLMDDYIVDDWWDCRRTVHQPEKYPENPVIVGEESWEADGPGNGCVLYDDQMGRFRVWASICDEELYKTKAPFCLRGIYYESEDGIHWERPKLGIIEWEGSKDNNLFYGGEYLFGAVSVIPTPPALSSKGRYVMLYGRAKYGGWAGLPKGQHTMQQRIAFSEDGIHWQDQPENPAFFGRSDTHNNIVYNPDRQVFMHYRRATIHANEIRRIAYSESKDLISWTQPKVIIAPDELDPPMLYGMTVSPYQDAYIGFLQMFYFHPDVKLAKSHQIDIQLASSRDGIHWQRHPERPIFLETGPIPSYDWGMVLCAHGIIERDEKVYLYYFAQERLHTSAVSGGKIGNFCLATLRKDGFVSLDAPEVGYMLTKPLECPGGNLHINAKTSGEGSIRVAIRRGDGEFDGEWLPEWNYDKADVFSGDSLDHILNWKGQKNLDSFKGKSIRLHFWLENAQLFSFWFE